MIRCFVIQSKGTPHAHSERLRAKADQMICSMMRTQYMRVYIGMGTIEDSMLMAEF